MPLPVPAPVLPMLAKRVAEIPEGDNWSFEPKWDGFRAIIFRDGDELLIQSRDTKPLNRYFPDLVEVLKAGLPERCVLDGEVVIAADQGNGVALNFDALSLRIHPAASRVKMLAETMPSSVIFFDLLCERDEDLRPLPFAERRKRLEKLLAHAKPPIHLTPATQDKSLAADWFRRFEGAGLDGVIAKPLDGPYQPDKRAMLKIKHERDCDCVVAGFRWHKDGRDDNGNGTLIGSLLLGLYDASGHLQHVGVCSSFTAAKRKELVEFLAPYRENALEGHPWAGWAGEEADAQRMPGGKSRWTGTKDLSWQPVRAELVVEVAYEHMQGDRFRHMAQFRRWRNDKSPKDCTYAQLEEVPAQELMDIFKSGN